MYLVRDVFKTKPGKAKELVNKFKQTFPYMLQEGISSVRIMTDVVAGYWTVVMETEIGSLSVFENHEGFTSRPQIKEIMKDYMTLVETGYREIYKLE